MFNTSAKTKSLLTAIQKAQKEYTKITKSADNPFFKSKYADLNAILDAVEGALEEQGVIILQPTTTDINGNNYVTTRLQHIDTEEFIESTLKLELSKTTMQELGSAVSYARRYTLQSLLTLQAEDDDGEKSMKREEKPAKTAAPAKTPAPAKAAASSNGNGKKATFKKPETSADKTVDDEW